MVTEFPADRLGNEVISGELSHTIANITGADNFELTTIIPDPEKRVLYLVMIGD